MEEDSQSTFETLLNAEENGERTADWEERENRGVGVGGYKGFVLCKPTVSHTRRLNLKD